MDGNGWVKIHRRILDNPIYKNPEYLSVWLTILLLAQHEESSFIWNGKKQILKEGQLLTGRKKLTELTGVNESKTYRILKYLENEQQIEQQKTSKFTVITIKNWKEYQKVNSKVNNRRTTDEQQMNTYKNVKNVKKINTEAKKILEYYNLKMKTNYKSLNFISNYTLTRKNYSVSEIKQAISNLSSGKWWASKPTPQLIFRQRSSTGAVDYIGELLNLKIPKEETDINKITHLT